MTAIAAAERRLMVINGSGALGGTELQTVGLLEWLRARGFGVSAIFDRGAGPMRARYDAAGIPYHVEEGSWPGAAARRFIATHRPTAFLVFGTRANLRWRLWLRLHHPDVPRWGAMRGFTSASAWGGLVTRLDRWSFRWVDGYVSNSRFAREYLVARGFPAERVLYLKNVVRTDPIPRRTDPFTVASLGPGGRTVVLPADVPVVLCVANVRPVKGHAELVRVLARLRAQGWRFLCVCAGTVDPAGPIVRDAERRGLGDAVVWAGFRPDVHELLARSDVLVLPSRREGCPNAVLEGMRAGLPIVASPWGDQRWLVEEGRGGFIADPRDADAWAGRLAALFADPARRAAMGRHNRARVRAEFDAAALEPEMLAVYGAMHRRAAHAPGA